MPITSAELQQAEKDAVNYAKVKNPGTVQYFASTQHREEIQTHFSWKGDPGDNLRAYRPNEPDDIHDYRVSSNAQLTFPIGHRIILVQRGTLSNSQTYGLLFPPPINTLDKKKSFEYYVRRRTPIPGRDLEKYFWEFMFPQMMKDANGYIGVMTKKGDEDKTLDTTKLRNPFPFIIPSTHILEEGVDMLIARSSLYVKIPKPDKKGFEDLPILWKFLDEGTIRLMPVSIRKDANGKEIPVYFAQAWNVSNPDDPTEEFELLVRKIGGLLQSEKVYTDSEGAVRRVQSVLDPDDSAFYLSILSLTLPYFQRSARIMSDLDGAIVSALFPVKTEEDTGCSNENCEDGYDTVLDATCTTCDGAGRKVSSGPFSGYIKQTNEAGELSPSVVWSAPPTDAFGFAWEQVQEANKGALRVLGMAVLDEGIGVQQTAREKEIDREQFLTVIREVAAIVYPALQWMLDRVNFLRYRGSMKMEELEKNRISVKVPTKYDVSGIEELFLHITKMQETSMPQVIRERLAENVIIKELGDDTQDGKLALTYLRNDRFSMYSEDEISALGARSNQSSEELAIDMIIHDNMKMIVAELMAENVGQRDFLSIATPLQQAEIRAKAKQIYDKAEEERAAKEAQAKADLSTPIPALPTEVE